MIPKAEERILNFEKLGFGLFIHFGLYSIMNKGEWISNFYQIDRDTYESTVEKFTACGFDAGKIASLAKRCGIKYITLTTRHHEGFSLYDTCGLSDFDSVHSPAKRDLVREFVDACNAEGIMPILYHTTLDWHRDDFNDDFEGYLEYLRKSVEILCTNYGKIGGIWFDGNWSKPAGTDWKEDELYATIRKHQPDAIIINNTGLSALGVLGNKELDGVTFEQSLPSALNLDGVPKYVCSEMCQTINCHWGNAANDYCYKSPAELIKNLCIARKTGSNYLLNIGPDGDGNLNLLQVGTLETIGKWIALCGHSIYNGVRSDISCIEDDFALDENGKSYIYINNLALCGDPNVTPEQFDHNKFRTLSNLKRKVRNIAWVDNGQDLEFVQNYEDETVTFNATPFSYGTNMVVRVAEVTYE